MNFDENYTESEIQINLLSEKLKNEWLWMEGTKVFARC